jgi:hypothetical protein
MLTLGLPYEIIVIDDCSADDTAAEVARLLGMSMLAGVGLTVCGALYPAWRAAHATATAPWPYPFAFTTAMSGRSAIRISSLTLLRMASRSTSTQVGAAAGLISTPLAGCPAGKEYTLSLPA